MTLPPSGNSSPPSAEQLPASESQSAGAPQAPVRDTRWESFWKRITISVSLSILAAVALFMLPKIDGRNSRLQVQADTRTELWRKELISSGKASPQTTPAATGDVWLLVGMIVGAGIVLGGLAYLALGPGRKARGDSAESYYRAVPASPPLDTPQASESAAARHPRS